MSCTDRPATDRLAQLNAPASIRHGRSLERVPADAAGGLSLSGILCEGPILA